MNLREPIEKILEKIVKVIQVLISLFSIFKKKPKV